MKLTHIFWGCAAALIASPALGADITIVHAGRLLAVPGGAVANEQSIIIRDGKIEAIMPGFVDVEAAGAEPDDIVAVHDLSNMFVLPGHLSIGDVGFFSLHQPRAVVVEKH